ncbi:hypothetical protein N9600_02185 [Flavobacteriaceae bacterium]|nr:hypothetical protein [Flavobacteriaceae bacterium]
MIKKYDLTILKGILIFLSFFRIIYFGTLENDILYIWYQIIFYNSISAYFLLGMDNLLSYKNHLNDKNFLNVLNKLIIVSIVSQIIICFYVGFNIKYVALSSVILINTIFANILTRIFRFYKIYTKIYFFDISRVVLTVLVINIFHDLYYIIISEFLFSIIFIFYFRYYAQNVTKTTNMLQSEYIKTSLLTFISNLPSSILINISKYIIKQDPILFNTFSFFTSTLNSLYKSSAANQIKYYNKIDSFSKLNLSSSTFNVKFFLKELIFYLILVVFFVSFFDIIDSYLGRNIEFNMLLFISLNLLYIQYIVFGCVEYWLIKNLLKKFIKYSVVKLLILFLVFIIMKFSDFSIYSIFILYVIFVVMNILTIIIFYFDRNNRSSRLW